MKAHPEARPTGTSRRTLILAFRTSAAGALVTYGFNLAVLPFVLGRVGPQLYGVWATVASILAVGALADAGVRTEIIRRVGAAKGAGDEEGLLASVHQGVTLLAAVTATVVVVGAVAAPLIRSFTFPHGIPGYSGGEIDLLIRATVLVLGVTIVGDAYFGVLRGVQRSDVETIAQLVGVPAGAGVTVLGITLGWGLWALFAGSVAQLAVTFVWEWFGTRRLVPSLRPRVVRITRNVAGAYLALSGLALVSQIGDVVDSQWDKLVLSHFVGTSAVTSFQIGTSIVLQGKAVALLALAPLLVAIAEFRHKEPARMEALFAVLAKSSMVLGSVVMGAIFIYAPSFVHLWLGSIPGAGTAARLFVVAAGLTLISAPLAYRAFGEEWHRIAAASALANMVVNGALSFALVVAVGFNGALYGSIAGSLAGTVVLVALMRRRLGPRWVPLAYRSPLIGVGSVLVAMALRLDRVHSWPLLFVSAAVYALVVGFACIRAERLRLMTLLRPTV